MSFFIPDLLSFSQGSDPSRVRNITVVSWNEAKAQETTYKLFSYYLHHRATSYLPSIHFFSALSGCREGQQQSSSV